MLRVNGPSLFFFLSLSLAVCLFFPLLLPFARSLSLWFIYSPSLFVCLYIYLAVCLSQYILYVSLSISTCPHSLFLFKLSVCLSIDREVWDGVHVCVVFLVEDVEAVLLGVWVVVKAQTPHPVHVREPQGVHEAPGGGGVQHQHPGVLPVRDQHRPVRREVDDAARVDGASLHGALETPHRAGGRAVRRGDLVRDAVTVDDETLGRRYVARSAGEHQLQGDPCSLTLQLHCVHQPVYKNTNRRDKAMYKFNSDNMVFRNMTRVFDAWRLIYTYRQCHHFVSGFFYRWV